MSTWIGYTLLGVLVVGIAALNVWSHRRPMTPEENQALDDEMRIY